MQSPIVALVNAKGGSGSTTLAVELALVIGRSASVAVVDGDLAGRRSLAVVLDCARQFDEARVPGRPAVVSVRGVTAAELVDELDASYGVRQETIDTLIASLSAGNVILADIPQPFASPVRLFVERASAFYIVLEPNLLGTAAARATIADLERFGVPTSRMALVTNLRDGRSSISSNELQKVLGLAVAAEIPNRGDRTYARCVGGFARRIAATVALEPIELRRASVGAPLGEGRLERQQSLPRLADLGSNGSALHAAGQNGSSRADPSGRELAPTATGTDPDRELSERIKSEIHEQLAKQLDLVVTSRAHTDRQKMAELRAQISQITDSVLALHGDVASAEQLGALRQEVIDEILGLGPLEDLMRDEAVTEIMVNGSEMIYVERKGKLERTQKRFVDDRQLRVILERIIAPLGRRLDEAQPMVDARLPDGSRVNAIIEPLALNGAVLTIRRFGTKRLTIADLVALDAISPRVVNLFRAMVQGRLNILVSGGTGSGKTTFLNILSGFLPNTERIITIEDAAELLLKQEHVVRLESRPANIEGRGEVRIRELVRNALRMRPDRIIVGECRGGEALDMLQAMNTGHDGSLTTVHANSPRDALSRLETLVLMAGFDLPIRAIREQIASAINVIVQIARLRDGSRKVVNVSEVIGMEGDVITMQEIVRYKQSGIDAQGRVVGEFQYSGAWPQCVTRFEETGVVFDVLELTQMPTGNRA